MGFIYRLPNGFLLKYSTQGTNYDFIPVKKSLSPLAGRDISIYIKNDNGEGIFGIGNILSNGALKSSEIENSKNIAFIKRDYFQINIHLHSFYIWPCVDIYHLRHFPAYNYENFDKPFNPYKLYWASTINADIQFVRSKFWYDFEPEYASLSVNSNWKYYIHFLRERATRSVWERKLRKENRECAFCGKKSDEPYFFEIHDTAIIDFEKDFIPLNIDNLVSLCPNCHKESHIKLRKEAVKDKK